MFEIPYIPREIINDYIESSLKLPDSYDYVPEFQDFLDEIECQNFNHRDAAICFLLDFSVEEASEALGQIDEENARDYAAIDREDRIYHDDQVNW